MTVTAGGARARFAHARGRSDRAVLARAIASARTWCRASRAAASKSSCSRADWVISLPASRGVYLRLEIDMLVPNHERTKHRAGSLDWNR